MQLFRRHTIEKKPLKEFFRAIGKNGLAFHGTDSLNLDSIRKKGLEAGNIAVTKRQELNNGAPFTHFKVSRQSLLNSLKKGGIEGLRVTVQKIVRNNISELVEHNWRQGKDILYFSSIGIVIGGTKVRLFDAKVGTEKNEILRYGIEHIPAKDIQMTINLSKEEIERLNKQFPEFKGALPARLPPTISIHVSDEFFARKKLLETEISRIITEKIIEKMLSKKTN